MMKVVIVVFRLSWMYEKNGIWKGSMLEWLKFVEPKRRIMMEF